MNRPILIFCLIRFLLYFSHWMVLAHLPLVMTSHRFSDMEIGTVISLYSVSSMALMPAIGLWTDFFSPKRLLLAGALCMTTAFVLLSRLHALYPVAAAVFMAGTGAAALIVVSESLYLKLYAGVRPGRRIAWFQLSTYLGFGLGPLAGSWLMGGGPPLLFLAAAVGGGAIFCCGLASSDYPAIDFTLKGYGDDIRRPRAMLLIAAVFVLGTHFGVEQTSFSLLLTKELGFSVPTVGTVFACLGLWMAAAVPLAGRLHDKRKAMFVFLLAGMALSGVMQMATPLARTLPQLLTVRLLHTLGDTLALLELTILTARVFPAARLGGNSGVMYAARTVATFTSAIAAGYVNRHGYGMSFALNGAFVVAFSMATAIFIGSGKDRRAALGWTKRP